MYQALWDIFVGNLCCYFILYFIAQGQNIYAWIDYVTTNKSVIYLWCFVISTLVQWDIYLWQLRISICIFGAIRYLSLILWDIYFWCFEISIFSNLGYLHVYLVLWDIYSIWFFRISIFGDLGYLCLVIWDICVWFNGISILSSIPATVGYLFMEWEPVNSNCFCKWTIQTSRVIPQDRQGSCELALNQMRGTGGWNTSLEGQIWQTRLSDIVYHYLWSCIKL